MLPIVLPSSRLTPAFSGESPINSIRSASPKRKPRNGFTLAAASGADRQHVIGVHAAESAAAARIAVKSTHSSLKCTKACAKAAAFRPASLSGLGAQHFS